MLMLKNNETQAHAWLDYDEAAQYLGVTRRQLERWKREGRVPHTKFPQRVVFTTAQLDAFIESCSVGPVGGDAA